jgi:hypothetical protein
MRLAWEGNHLLRTTVGFLMTALMLASLLSVCAAGWPPPPTAPECVFIPRCRNPALTTPGGTERRFIAAIGREGIAKTHP